MPSASKAWVRPVAWRPPPPSPPRWRTRCVPSRPASWPRRSGRRTSFGSCSRPPGGSSPDRRAPASDERSAPPWRRPRGCAPRPRLRVRDRRRPDRGARGRLARGPARQHGGVRRAEWLRQVDPAEADLRSAERHRGRDHRGRAAGRRPADERRHGVPEPGPPALAQRARQRAAPSGDPVRERRPARSGPRSLACPRGGLARHGRPERRGAPPAARALGRHAPARESLPRADPSAGAPPAGRAVRRPRRVHAGGDVGALSAPAGRAGIHGRAGDPRPPRGDLPGRRDLRSREPSGPHRARAPCGAPAAAGAGAGVRRRGERADAASARADPAQSRARGMIGPRSRRVVLPLAVFVGLVLAWEAAVTLLHVQPIVLPPPSGVALTMARTAGPIAFHAWHTLLTTLLGFVAAVGLGLLLGFAIGGSATVNDALYPLLVGFNSIPKAAVVPLLVMWFGIGTAPAVLTAFLLAFFPVAVNVAVGLATLEAED